MYQAKIIRIVNIEKHPDADRLQIIRYNSMSFVVDLSFNAGDLVCLFPTDGQLSHDFCRHNNLYRVSALNDDETATGYFENSRRVRAQPFRKVKSEGFVCKLEAFNYIPGNKKFELLQTEGYEFDSLDGVVVCEKYVTEATKQAMARNKARKSKQQEIEYMLNKHFETGQLDYKIDTVPDDCLVIITEKLHGTSGRTGMVRIEKRVTPWYKRMVNNLFRRRVFDEVFESTYGAVTGTRNTICNTRPDVTTPGASDHYRWMIHEQIAPMLKKGETVYYEIVGYTNTGQTIMNIQSVAALKNKNMTKAYGDTMEFSYGCYPHPNEDHDAVKQFDVYVYRITMQGHGGDSVDLSWFELRKRCVELGLKFVPELCILYFDTRHKEINNAKLTISAYVGTFLDDGPSILDARHIREGVCVRIESPEGMTILKSKNYAFKVLEGIIKEDSKSVDVEESN
jgi:hypothetical protein